MATSGITSGLMTVGEFVTSAMEIAQLIEPGESVTRAEKTLGVKHLTWMLKSWQADGLNQWRGYDGVETILAGDSILVTSPPLLDVYEMRVLANGIERPMTRWEFDDYSRLPNKTSPGSPTIFAVKPGLNALSVYVWPVPIVDTDVLFSGARVIEDVTDIAETLDVPQGWTETVIYGLAARLLAVKGRAEANPLVVAQAEALYRKMLAADRPAAYIFEPA